MGPNGTGGHSTDQKIYIYGLTYLSDSRSTSDIVPCVYPVSLVEQLVSTDSTSFAEEFQIDSDVYDLWTLVTAEHIQEENHYIATIDMQTGFNFVSALDVYLSPMTLRLHMLLRSSALCVGISMFKETFIKYLLESM